MERPDISFKINNIQIKCRAVSIIVYNDAILMQKRSKDNFWTLPGGKIEILEKGEDAIKRELSEEIGVNFSECILYDVKENFFEFENQKYHEFIFMYLINSNEIEGLCVDKDFWGIETQKKLQFRWMEKEELESENIAPTWLKSELLKYLSQEPKGKTKIIGSIL